MGKGECGWCESGARRRNLGGWGRVMVTARDPGGEGEGGRGYGAACKRVRVRKAARNLAAECAASQRQKAEAACDPSSKMRG